MFCKIQWQDVANHGTLVQIKNEQNKKILNGHYLDAYYFPDEEGSEFSIKLKENGISFTHVDDVPESVKVRNPDYFN